MAGRQIAAHARDNSTTYARRRRMALTTAAALVFSAVSAVAYLSPTAASAAVPGPVTFFSNALNSCLGFTGSGSKSNVDYTVPATVTAVTIVAVGGHGDKGNDAHDHGGGVGGRGGVVTATLAVTPGEHLYASSYSSSPPGGSADGGESTIVALDTFCGFTYTLPNTPIVVAGGGGGGGWGDTHGPGGTGGDAQGGGNAGGSNEAAAGGGGNGGSSTAGGSGGAAGHSSSETANAGSTGERWFGGSGGTGSTSSGDGGFFGTGSLGGGGGGGYWGGGGGGGGAGNGAGGGGGGGDFVISSGTDVTKTISTSANVSVTFSPAAFTYPTTTVVTASSSGSVTDTYSALVAASADSPAPSGTVSFSAKLVGSSTTVAMGSVTLGGDGLAPLTYTLPSGHWNVTATYSGGTDGGINTNTGSTSAAVLVTILPPAPTGLTSIRGGSSALIRWTPPSTGVGSPVTGYYVYYGTSIHSASATQANTSPTPLTSYTVHGLTAGQTYFMTVASVNAAGDTGDVSSVITVPTGTALTGVSLTVTPPPTPDIYYSDGIFAGSVFKIPATGGAPVSVVSGLEFPGQIATDSAGNLYIADGSHNRVLKVTPGGVQTTVGSGLSGPRGVAVDAAGNVFIADTNNGRVVEVLGDGTNVQSTIMTGLGLASRVAVDAVGNVYVSDNSADQVMERLATDHSSIPIASGLDGPTGIAVNGDGDVYIADANHQRIVLVPANGGAQSVVASGITAAADLAVTASGDLLITDGVAKSVLKVAAGTTTLSTVVSGLTGAAGIALVSTAQVTPSTSFTLTAHVDTAPVAATPSGTVTFFDGASSIGTATLVGSFPDTATLVVSAGLTSGVHHLSAKYGGDSADAASATSALITVNAFATASAPRSVTAAPSNSAAQLSWLTPTSNGGNAISGYNVYKGTSPGQESSTPVNAAPITGLSYVISSLTNGTTYYFTVKAINAAGTGTPSAEIAATIRHATGTTLTTNLSPRADVYVVDQIHGRIVKVTSDGTLTNAASGSALYGAAVDSAGNLYYANSIGTAITKQTPAGTTSALGSGFNFPQGLAVSPAGDVFVADGSNSRVVKIPADGSAQVTLGTFNLAGDIAVDSAGDVFVTTGAGGVVELPSGGGPSFTVSTGTQTVQYAEGVAVDSAGNVYIADANGQKIVKVSASGSAAVVSTAPLSVGGDLRSLAVDAGGNLFISDTNNSRVIEVPAGGGAAVTVGSGFAPLRQVAVAVPTLLTQQAQITLQATVLTSAGGPASTGTVTFFDGSTNLGSASLSGGVASLTVADGLGTHQYTASYAGNTDHGASSSSAVPVTVTGTAPGAPTALHASGGNESVALTWTAPTDNGGSAITGYNVYRSTGAGTESSTPINSSLITTTSYLASGLTDGTTYYFTVKAVNAIGTSTASNEASATPVGATSVSVTDNASSIHAGGTLSFTATVSGAGATPTGTVTWSLTGPGSPTCASSTLAAGVATCSVPSAASGSYTAAANYGGNATYAGSTGNDSATVNKADQTIAFTTPSGVVYGQADAALGATASSGLAVSYSSSTSSVCTIVSGKLHVVTAGTCTIAADQAGSAAYNAAPQISHTFGISSAPITVTVTGSQTYGGSPTFSATTDVAGVTASNVSCAKTSTVTITATLAVGSYPLAGPTCSATLSNPNYAPTYSGMFTVSAAPITVTVTGAQTYGGSPTFTADTDVAGVTASAASCLKVIPGSPINVLLGAGSYALDGSSCSATLSNANYTPTFTGSLTVAKKSVAVSASGGSMVYGGLLPIISASFSGFVNGQYESVLTSLVTCSSNVSVTTAAGSYPDTSSCSGGAAANYSFSYPGKGTITVSQALLTVTASDGVMTYAGALPTITPGYSGFQNGEGAAVLGTQPTCASNVTITTAVGSYPDTSTCSGAAAANYSFGYVAGTVTVHPAPLTVTITGSQTYGGPASFTAVTNVAGVGASAASCLTVIPGTPINTLLAAGSYALDGSTCGAAISNPNYTPSYTGTLTVAKKNVAVTASDASMVYGGVLPVITPSFSGFVNGQNESVLTTPVSCSPNVTVFTAAGNYPNASSCSSGAAANYTFSYAKGTVTVTKAVLTVTASDASMTYGAAPPAITSTIVGFKNAQGAGVVSPKPTCVANVTAATPAGSYPDTSSCSGAGAANYTFVYVNGTVTVNPKTVTVTPIAVSTPYGVVPAVSASYTGFVNGQTTAVLTHPAACQPNTTTTTTVGVHANTSTCTGATAPNYAFAYAKGTVTIVKAAVTITTTSTTVLASVLLRGMRFTSTVHNAASAAPVANIAVTVHVPTGLLGQVVTCTATTNAQGVAVCVSQNAALLLIKTPRSYTATTPTSTNYLAGTGNGLIKLA